MVGIKSLIFLFILAVFLAFVGAKLNLSTLVVKPSPFGADATPPAPPQYTNSPPQETKEKIIQLKGLGEANSKVSVKVNDVEVAVAQVNEESKFSTDVPLVLGLNEIFLFATDKSGNTSEQSVLLKINRI